MGNDLSNEIAAFRFGLIAPVMHRKLKPGEKYALLREIASGSYTIPGSDRSTVSIRTLERYLEAYEKEGFEGLRPRKREKKGSLQFQKPEVLERAIELRKELPSRSVEKVIQILEYEKLVALGEMKARTLSRFYLEQGWSRRDIHRTIRKEFRQFEHDASNDSWQADTQHTLYLPDPKDPTRRKKAYLIGIIDDHSRKIMHGEFFFEERYPRLERCVQKAVLKHGVPHQFFCDNGSVYIAKQFSIICARMGTKLIHAKPYSPESKGKIEKFFQFVDSSFVGEANLLINQGKLTTLQQLNDFFKSWLEMYDNRVHRTTKQTPKKRFEDGLVQPRILTAEELQELFLWEEDRTVRKTSIIELEGNQYDVDASLRGKKIQVRYSPFDLSYVQIWSEGQQFPNGTTAVLRSQSHSKSLPTVEDKMAPTGVPHYFELMKARQEEEKRKNVGTMSYAKLSQNTQEGIE